MPSFKIDGEVEQRYKILRHIGSGAYGVVWCAHDRVTGKQVALKKVFDAFGNQQDAQRTYREVMLLSSLRDNNRIVQLVNVIRAVNNIDIYLIFELSETDLTVVLRTKILQDIHRRYLAYQVVLVTAQLHARRVIHRDLKPANIFVNTDCTIILGDFGLARSFYQDSENKDAFLDLTDYIATRWYRSPEILVKSNVYTTAMDMWAIGCVVGELLLGHPLLHGSSTVNQMELIIAATGEPTEADVDSLCSPHSWGIMDSLPAEIASEPLSERLRDYDPDAVDLIERCIVFNPNKRLTAREALKHPYVAQFVKPEDLASLEKQKPVVLPLPDNEKFDRTEYMESLYHRIATVYRHKQ